MSCANRVARGSRKSGSHWALAREVDGNRVAQRESRDTAHVVVMLVRHHDARDLRGREAHAFQPGLRVGEREAAVHQDARRPALDNQPVAGAAAAEGREAQHYFSWS